MRHGATRAAPNAAVQSRSVRPAAPVKSLVWIDDFVGTGSPNPNNWLAEVGRFGLSNGEQEYYTNAAKNVYLDGASNLAIATYNETTPDAQTPPSTTAYTSGRVSTRTKKTFSPPVKVAARLKVPYTKGLWPALWMVGDSAKALPGYTNWPALGEIDICEWVTNQYTCNGHLHLGQNGSLSTNVGPTSYGIIEPRTFNNHYFVFGIDWYTDRIDWHIDGSIVGTLTQSQVNTSNNADWTPLGASGWPFFININMAVGSTTWSAVGQPDVSSTFPQTMLVDWVGVWNI